MKNCLKYIKINGKLKSRGDFGHNSSGFRNYNSVTIVEKNGAQVCFQSLGVSEQLDAHMDLDQEMTFYILQAQDNLTITGIVYAIVLKKKKLFYPDTTIPALQAFAAVLQKRYPIVTNPMLFVGTCFTVGMLVSIALSKAFGLDIILTMLVASGVTGVYILGPVINKSKNAGLDQMINILTSDGFDLSGK
ncbi:MAG: hypothetical protein ABIJ31_14685 [Pseudomonadota bacterium]